MAVVKIAMPPVKQTASDARTIRSDTQRWMKLSSHLGLAYVDVEMYGEYLVMMHSSKISRLRFPEDLPSYEQFMQLRESWCNARCESELEISRKQILKTVVCDQIKVYSNMISFAVLNLRILFSE